MCSCLRCSSFRRFRCAVALGVRFRCFRCVKCFRCIVPLGVPLCAVALDTLGAVALGALGVQMLQVCSCFRSDLGAVALSVKLL